MIPMNELQAFIAEPHAQAYLLVVLIAFSFSFRRYYNCADKKGGAKHPASVIPPLLSLCVLGVTWFYIFRFIVTHIYTSKSYFGDAYRDVLKDEGQYMISVQLLTWAVVSAIWMEDEGQAPGDLVFLGYGFLGAMSASFVLWVPSLYRRIDRSRSYGRRTVSLFCVLCAVVAFVCIVNIAPCSKDTEEECQVNERFGSFRPSFEAWLHGLHYVLIVPALGKLVPPLQALRVDAAVVYFVAGMVLSAWHVSLLVKSYQSHLEFVLSSSVPMTDCQKSITTDMVCCSLITLYAIYRDNLLTAETGRFGHWSSTKEAARTTALVKTSLAALQLAIFSPAATLAFHLCSRSAGSSHMALVSRMQQRVAQRMQAETRSKHQKIKSPPSSFLQGPTWCNLGLWEYKNQLASGYDEACERLALALATTVGLNSEDGVLCCGCGSGPELDLYKSKFQVKHITGIDPEIDRVQAWETDRLLRGGDFNIRRIKASVEDLIPFTGDFLFRPSLFTKILALDNVYHYSSKYNFFRDCAALLPPGGKVAVTDILVRDTPLWLRGLLVVLGIPYGNQWTKTEYTERLSDLGYVDIEIQSTEGSVFAGWVEYLPSVLTQYLDYSIIAAALSTTEKQVSKTKVAIIGSGLAGLTAAHSLSTSSENVQVTVFEAYDSPGLAGNSEWHEGHLIDIPPRMASRGYYKEYRKMLKELNMPTQMVKTDCTYFGGDETGEDSNIYAYYDKSNIQNFLFAILKGGFSNFLKIAFAMSKEELNKSGKCNGHSSKVVTFADWLGKHSLYTSCTTDTLEMCRDNPFLYLIVGSLGWMLSCTYHQLLEYPADIIMPYLQSLFLASTSMTGDAEVIRVSPSIKVLEQTLLYGIEKIICGARVSGLDKTKIINGVKYDFVICATEARAVSKVLKNAPKVFSKVKYHPSIIYLHTDDSFMPRQKKDWRRWTVDMGSDEAQLTFWLNEVYPDSRFSTNVFQTWAPLHSPKPETIIKKASFERVVHTAATKVVVSDIEAEQGKEGFYFAGSYTVYGMGLLEQALISGRKAANSVLDELQKK